MRFSDFLQIIYEYRNNEVTRQDLFLKGLFDSTGNDVFYTNDYYKRIFNGQKPLTTDLRGLFKTEINKEEVASYLRSSINAKRINELISDFGIADDEDLNFSVLCESLALQFINYIKYGDQDIQTEVNNIYLTLLDQYGNGSIEHANEQAFVSAKQYIVQSLEAIASIESRNDLFSLQRPFENFFDSIYKAFRIYNKECNREGREIMRKAKLDCLDGSLEDVDEYLSKIIEPGSNPIRLVKELYYIFYDNYLFEDKVLSVVIHVGEEYDNDQLLEDLSKEELYPNNELFFSEYIIFREENSKKNLLAHVNGIINRVSAIFRTIRLELDNSYSGFSFVDEKYSDAMMLSKGKEMQFVSDGAYYPQENKIEFAPIMMAVLGMRNGEVIKTGEDKMLMKQHPILKDYDKLTIRKLSLCYNAYMTSIWSASGKFGDPMAELMTFNRDGTFRWFMFPVTSKAKVYRIFREVAERVYEDNIEGFIFSSMLSTVAYKDAEDFERLFNMKAEERIALGEDSLTTIGYRRGKFAKWDITKDRVLKHLGPVEETCPMAKYFPACMPLVFRIEALREHLKLDKN